MIIATIAGHKFKLDSMQDAEALLRILERSQPVGEEFGTDYNIYFHPSHQIDVGIEITHRELVSDEVHAERVAQKRERIRAAAIEAGS